MNSHNRKSFEIGRTDGFESWDIAPLYSNYEGITYEQAVARNKKMAKRRAKRLGEIVK